MYHSSKIEVLVRTLNRASGLRYLRGQSIRFGNRRFRVRFYFSNFVYTLRYHVPYTPRYRVTQSWVCLHLVMKGGAIILHLHLEILCIYPSVYQFKPCLYTSLYQFEICYTIVRPARAFVGSLLLCAIYKFKIFQPCEKWKWTQNFEEIYEQICIYFSQVLQRNLVVM